MPNKSGTGHRSLREQISRRLEAYMTSKILLILFVGVLFISQGHAEQIDRSCKYEESCGRGIVKHQLFSPWLGRLWFQDAHIFDGSWPDLVQVAVVWLHNRGHQGATIN